MGINLMKLGCALMMIALLGTPLIIILLAIIYGMISSLFGR